MIGEGPQAGSLWCGGRELPLGRTWVMGIVNVTPDSFSDGGRFVQPASTARIDGRIDVDAAVAHALALDAAGADVLDIGGESTRPGATPVPPDVELSRVLPIVRELARRGVRHLSIDTRNASTAAACLDAGASWINDVSALAHDAAMAEQAARADAVVLMHARGVDRQEPALASALATPLSPTPPTPPTSPTSPTPPTAPQTSAAGLAARYGDDVRYPEGVVLEVQRYLAARVAFAVERGLARTRIVVDPGIGFGKSVDDNVALTRAVGDIAAAVGCPLLYGPSRKRFLGALTGIDDPAARDAATLGAIAAAVRFGARIVRVHDVAGTVAMLRVLEAIAPPPVGA